MTKQDCAAEVCKALCDGYHIDVAVHDLRLAAGCARRHAQAGRARGLSSAADWLEKWGAAAEAPDPMGEMVEAAAQAYAASGGGAGETAEARRDNIAACILNVAEGLPVVACRAAALKAIAAHLAGKGEPKPAPEPPARDAEAEFHREVMAIFGPREPKPAPEPAKPTCIQCGKPAQHTSHPEGPVCSLKCYDAFLRAQAEAARVAKLRARLTELLAAGNPVPVRAKGGNYGFVLSLDGTEATVQPAGWGSTVLAWQLADIACVLAPEGESNEAQ